MKEIEVKNVIVSKLTTRGSGKGFSPTRYITQVFGLKGNMIAESDIHTFTIESLHDFIKYRFKGDEYEKVLGWAIDYFLNKDEE